MTGFSPIRPQKCSQPRCEREALFSESASDPGCPSLYRLVRSEAKTLPFRSSVVCQFMWWVPSWAVGAFMGLAQTVSEAYARAVCCLVLLSLFAQKSR